MLYWKVLGTEIDASDITSPVEGSFKVLNSSSESLSLQFAADYNTEGIEKFRIGLFSDSSFANSIAVGNYVSIQDTSKTPTYSISPSSSTVDEGQNLEFKINTTNLPSQHRLYWELDDQFEVLICQSVRHRVLI